MSNFVRVANTDALKPGECRVITAKGKTLALYNVNNQYFATENSCSHRAGPLGDGILDGDIVTCPWHGWQFDVTTGKREADDQVRLKTFDVMVTSRHVLVKL